MPGTVRVRFFASYAEIVGREETELDMPLPTTVAEVVRRVRSELRGGTGLPERPLAAVNLRQVRLESAVKDGDEVAFLPPLAGG